MQLSNYIYIAFNYDLLFSDSELFKCDKCERVFTTNQAMLNHKQRHKDNGEQKRHSCTMCSYSTKYSSHLKQHIFTHTGERPFKCTDCSAGFTQNSLLKKHMLTHTTKEETQNDNTDKPSSPESTKSSKSFSLKKRLLGYTTKPKEPTKKLKCEKCSKKFDDSKKLAKHARKHKRQDKSHKCTQCSKRFSELSSLKKHEKEHILKEKDSDENSSNGATNSSSE